MPFPARLLNDGEEVVVDVRPHWWYLAGPVVALAAVIAGAVAAAVESAPTWVTWVAVGALVLAAAWLIGRYIRWASTSLVVTTSRLIRRTGVLARNGREIPLAALTDISYHQSLLERVIGAGDVLLESAGREGQEVFPDLPGPARIQQAIAVQVDRLRRRGGPTGPTWLTGPTGGAMDGPTSASGTGFSISAQIEELDGLRRRGLISDAEFEAKKTELLDRL
jgi:membrane protein YdbS with pleckstrin-like domain